MKVLLLLLLLLTTAAGAIAQGTLIHDTLYSAALNQQRAVDVYLPNGYDVSADRYPVIYFLHGLGSNQSGYTEIVPVLDALIADGLVRPTIVVKPDGSCAPYEGSMYTNSALYGAFEDYINVDLVTYIDGTYRTRTERAARTIMGHSMGGYGSMKSALKHGDLYCGVAVLSGWMSVTPFDYWRDQVLTENGGHGPYNPAAGFFSLATYTAAGAFSPNLNLLPYQVDFPLDSAGNVVDSIKTAWELQMPGWLARQSTTAMQTAIYFDCGTMDELGFYPMNQNFAATLDSLGIPHRFESFIGDHTNQLIVRGTLALVYLDSVMREAEDVSTPYALLPARIELLQNYPNPFNGRTAIEFELPQAAMISLGVFDLMGRQVATLADGKFAAGSHRVTFDGSSIASGMYFCRLTEGARNAQVRKMVIVK
jgi:enterochelin esterase-like enzyme